MNHSILTRFVKASKSLPSKTTSAILRPFFQLMNLNRLLHKSAIAEKKGDIRSFLTFLFAMEFLGMLGSSSEEEKVTVDEPKTKKRRTLTTDPESGTSPRADRFRPSTAQLPTPLQPQLKHRKTDSQSHQRVGVKLHSLQTAQMCTKSGKWMMIVCAVYRISVQFLSFFVRQV